jgi:thioredoxin reductase
MDRAASLFLNTGYLRDTAILTWELRTCRGRPQIEEMLREASDLVGPRNFSLTTVSPSVPPETEDGRRLVDAILAFETDLALGKGVLRLECRRDGTCQALFLSTILHGLKGYPEREGAWRPTRAAFTPTAPRESTPACGLSGSKATRQTDVLIVGAGQSGLAVGARLRALDVDPLIIDQYPRIGDNWRKRYTSLSLHNAIWVNDLPYMEFPTTWPIYLTKDQLAAWFEIYAQVMDLDVSTSTRLMDAEYNFTSGQWVSHVTVPTGGVAEVHSKHIVMATGVSGIARRPEIAGLDAFQGPVLHSSEFIDGASLDNSIEKRPIDVVVFGTGNSGHDIAHELCLNGQFRVTMVQRSSTTVINLSTVREIYDKNVYDRSIPRMSPEDEDLRRLSMPLDLVVQDFQVMNETVKELDKD